MNPNIVWMIVKLKRTISILINANIMIRMPDLKNVIALVAASIYVFIKDLDIVLIVLKQKNMIDELEL